jgi:hypothetical protein
MFCFGAPGGEATQGPALAEHLFALQTPAGEGVEQQLDVVEFHCRRWCRRTVGRGLCANEDRLLEDE